MAVADYSDTKPKTPFNPFFTRHELTLERYPDPTLPLPELNGARGRPISSAKTTRKMNNLKRK